jgi:hypothetical protein
MNWAQALVVSQTLGYTIAFLGRVVPFIPNKVVPKIGYFTILLTNIVTLWHGFADNASTVAAALDDHFGVTVSYAGFWGALGAVLKPVISIAQPIGLSYLQYWLNRLAHEGTKDALPLPK